MSLALNGVLCSMHWKLKVLVEVKENTPFCLFLILASNVLLYSLQSEGYRPLTLSAILLLSPRP